MRSTLILVALLRAISCSSQCLDSLGLDSSYVLNACEQRVLLQLGGSWPYKLPARSPVIAFLHGNSAERVSKPHFFGSFVRPWLETGKEPVLSWYILSKEESERTGLDALVKAGSKFSLTEKQRKRLLDQQALIHSSHF
jgi:hypothetical protein